MIIALFIVAIAAAFITGRALGSWLGARRVRRAYREYWLCGIRPERVA